MFRQFLKSGTGRQFGVAKVTEISMKFLLKILLPWITKFTNGYSRRAKVAAFKKRT